MTQAQIAKEQWDIERRLAKLSSSVKTKRCHWINTPNGDLGAEWCTDCGLYKLRNLRRRDRKHRDDYILDGGWRTCHDVTQFCCSCGALLDGSLTEYGAREELEHYASQGFRPGDPFDAHHLGEMLFGLPEKDAAEGLEIAKRFCAESGI